MKKYNLLIFVKKILKKPPIEREEEKRVKGYKKYKQTLFARALWQKCERV